MSMAGLATMISNLSVASFSCVTGIILLANKNASPLKKIVITTSGRMNLTSGMPAALMATSSKDSPKFPKVMMEEKRSANGSAMGTHDNVTRPIKYKRVGRSNPLPTKSSMYNQKNCMVSTNNEIRKAPINGPIKERIMSMSNFLIKALQGSNEDNF